MGSNQVTTKEYTVPCSVIYGPLTYPGATSEALLDRDLDRKLRKFTRAVPEHLEPASSSFKASNSTSTDAQPTPRAREPTTRHIEDYEDEPTIYTRIVT